MAKLGEGHAAAMFRLGLKELRNAANPSRESIADTEIGLYGTQTQGEIAQARKGPSAGPEEESVSLDQMRKETETQKGNERGGREQDRGLER
jgi:hypothetical protein